MTPLVKTKGAELGVRTEVIPGLQSSLALWRLKLGSELVFVGDAGDTEASRASSRYGIEWNNHWVLNRWLLLDLDLAVSHARFTQDDPAGNYIPGSIDRVAAFGVTVPNYQGWFGSLQWRYFGPRPLTEDNSQRSYSTTLANLRVGRQIDPSLRVGVGRLQPVQPQGQRHRLLLRLAPGRRTRGGRERHPFPPGRAAHRPRHADGKILGAPTARRSAAPPCNRASGSTAWC